MLLGGLLLLTSGGLCYATGGAARLIHATSATLLLAAAIPMHMVLQGSLRATWLCTGALAMAGAYSYALLAAKLQFLGASIGPAVAVLLGGLCAGALTAFVGALSTWLTRPVLPLVTLAMHLLALDAIAHNKDFTRLTGGTEGLSGLAVPPGLAKSAVVASPTDIVVQAIPVLLGIALVLIGRRRFKAYPAARVLGQSPRVFVALGGSEFATTLGILVPLGFVLGLSGAASVVASGSCAPSSFAIVSSLLPLVAVEGALGTSWWLAFGILGALSGVEYSAAAVPFLRDVVVPGGILGILLGMWSRRGVQAVAHVSTKSI